MRHLLESFAEEHVGCIVMELLEGRSLARELTDGPLDLARAKSIALQTADAPRIRALVLDRAPGRKAGQHHDRGMKTTVKVTDFGIARILSVDTMMGTVATTGMRVGTPLYMAPGTGGRERASTRGSDVYGFGAVLYHMVTGSPAVRRKRRPGDRRQTDAGGEQAGQARALFARKSRWTGTR